MRYSMFPRVALVALTFALSAEPSPAQNLTLTRSARSGIDSLIGYERAWDRSCAAKRSTVTITRQPANGSAYVAQGTSKIPASTPRGGDTGQCAGKTIAGNQVMYRSRAGFHGTDFVSWDAVFDGGGGHVDVTIDVR